MPVTDRELLMKDLLMEALQYRTLNDNESTVYGPTHWVQRALGICGQVVEEKKDDELFEASQPPTPPPIDPRIFDAFREVGIWAGPQLTEKLIKALEGK